MQGIRSERGDHLFLEQFFKKTFLSDFGVTLGYYLTSIKQKDYHCIILNKIETKKLLEYYLSSI